eukprot:736652-Rhodomonas_salina.3
MHAERICASGSITALHKSTGLRWFPLCRRLGMFDLRKTCRKLCGFRAYWICTRLSRPSTLESWGKESFQCKEVRSQQHHHERSNASGAEDESAGGPLQGARAVLNSFTVSAAVV